MGFGIVVFLNNLMQFYVYFKIYTDIWATEILLYCFGKTYSKGLGAIASGRFHGASGPGPLISIVIYLHTMDKNYK